MKNRLEQAVLVKHCPEQMEVGGMLTAGTS